MELTTAQADYVTFVAKEIDKSFTYAGAKNLLAPSLSSTDASSPFSGRVTSLQLLCCRVLIDQRSRITENLQEKLSLEVQAFIVQSEQHRSLQSWVFINLSLNPTAVQDGTKELLRKNGLHYGIYDVMLLNRSSEQAFLGYCFKQMINSAPAGLQQDVVEQIINSMNAAKPITAQSWNRLSFVSERVGGVVARILQSPLVGLVLGILAYNYAGTVIRYSRGVIIPRINQLAIQHLPLWAIRRINQGLEIAEMIYRNIGAIWFYTLLAATFGPQSLRPTANKIQSIAKQILLAPFIMPLKFFFWRLNLISKVMNWTRQSGIQLDQIKDKVTNRRLGLQLNEAYHIWLKWAPHWHPPTPY